jgi:hypothetical protein
LTFEVVGFRGTYHAVLGRPCYEKFMAVPNYTYLKLKMPGPNGVITVGPTYKHAFECDVECVEYAEALAESEALIADLENLSKEVPDVKRHAGNFELAETVKAVPPDPSGDTSRQIRIGLSSTPDRKQCSPTFSAQTPMSLRGVPRTCPACRGTPPSTRWIFGPKSHPSGSLSASVIKEGSASPRQSPTLPRGLKRGNPSVSRLGVLLRVKNFQSKRSLLRSPGYVRSKVSGSERGYM